MAIRDVLNGPPMLYEFNLRFGQLSREQLVDAARKNLQALASSLVDDTVVDENIPEEAMILMGRDGVVAFIEDKCRNLRIMRNSKERELKRAKKLLNRVNVPSNEWERALMLGLVKKNDDLKNAVKRLHYDLLVLTEALSLLGATNE